MLPAELYGKISTFLELSKRIEYDSETNSDSETDAHENGDIMNLCIAGGKIIADVIRSTYLHKNEDYLRQAIFSIVEITLRIGWALILTGN